MQKYSLNGEWTFADAKNNDFLPCRVPGSNYTHLLELGKIDDPFVGMNEASARWVGETDWVYTRDFELDKTFLENRKIFLSCKMLDTVCEIFINDTSIAKCNNNHIGYTFEVKDFLKLGKNNIRINFDAPINYIEKMQQTDKMPNASMGVDGVPHIRKAQSHFGWDWGPILPPCGILKDIDLLAYDNVKIESCLVEQLHDISTTVNLHITSELSVFGETPFKFLYELDCPDGAKIRTLSEKQDITLSLVNPHYWYPHDVSGLDEQPLYKFRFSLVDAEGTVFDKIERTLGLRSIELDRRKDIFGRNFEFIINNVPVFAKGANWIPMDSFIDRVTPEKLEYMLRSVRDANMNMIRVWGGGYYESDEFYELCDKYGIMVWQDCGFACAPYPFYNEEFLENVKNEITYNVKRLRLHPSLVLWCGNNEIEMMTIGWQLRKKLVDYTDIFFHKTLGKFIRALDPRTPFIVGSPCSSEGFLKNVNADHDGDTHLWHVWHGLQPLTYYRKRFTRFCSEFGLESMPDMRTIKYFARPEDYSLQSDVFMAHQKCLSGNNKMLYYMSTRFRIPKNFDDLVYQTQIIQSECVKDATEHWRRNRSRCHGSLYWQLNDCWPVSSWSSMDYFGRFKALQYNSRHFNSPVTLSLLDNKSEIDIFTINDTTEELYGHIEYALEDFEGKILTKGSLKTKLLACYANSVFKIDLKPYLKKQRNCVFHAEYFDDKDNLVARRTHLFSPEKDLALPKCDFKTDVTVSDDTAYITVSSDKYARFVWLSTDFGYKPFSDNCFDMLAGEEVIVTLPAEGKSAKEIADCLSVQCVNNVVPKGTKFGDTMTRIKISLIPINIANRIYYHTV